MKVVLILLLFLSSGVLAQTVCPPNIGFENGDMDQWQPFTGQIAADGTLSVNPGLLYHQVYKNGAEVEKDPFGGFPVVAPNGSLFSVKLGDDQPGRSVSQLAYAFTVPARAEGFSIIFNYAVVLEDPGHAPHEQPRFTVKVYNESRGSYIQCSSFDFVAGYNQPDFIPASAARNVFYKPWSSAAINLSAFRGEKLRLEFSVNDCSRGGHFGYAYFDVMQKCTNSVTGNIICPGTDNVTLHAPVGFAGYEWYNKDFSQRLSTSNTFLVQTPSVGDSFAVVLLPYAYLGCRDTFRTSIISASSPMHLSVKDKVNGCDDAGVDLTHSSLTAGSSDSLQFDYFSDSAATAHLPNARLVMASGVYYIKATNPVGCLRIKPVSVTIYPVPVFNVTAPPMAEYPQTIDLTTVTDNPQLQYTFWQDKEQTRPVLTPMAVGESGTYFIRGTNQAQCSIVRTVDIKVSSRLNMPTAFTPNNDGRNDRFRITAQGGMKQVAYFKIFNRWGQEVFSSTDPAAAWDGTFKGKPVEAGVYIWMLKGTDFVNKTYSVKGTVMLIR
jgi:gliding motility-associated-like protein